MAQASLAYAVTGLCLVALLLTPAASTATDGTSDQVRNVTLTFGTPSRTCSNCSDNRQTLMPTSDCSSNGFSQQFQDPFVQSPGSSPDELYWIVVSVSVEAWGRWNCDNESSGASVGFALDTALIGNLEQAPRLPIGGCSNGAGECPNCAVPFRASAGTDNSGKGWDGFVYGGLNTLQVLVSGGKICLSQVVLTLVYAPGPPTVDNMSPRLGPLSGNTIVSVWGNYFRNSSTQVVSCIFGETIPTAAVYVSPVQIRCPTLPGTGSALLTLDVSQDNRTFSVQTQYSFAYYKDPTLLSVVPATGDSRGGDEVVIVADQFVSSPLLACSFGGFMVAATLINSTAVECIAPAGLGSVAVTVTENGQQFVNSSLEFFYAAKPPTRSIIDYALLVIFGVTVVASLVIGVVLMTWMRIVAYSAAKNSSRRSRPIPVPIDDERRELLGGVGGAGSGDQSAFANSHDSPGGGEGWLAGAVDTDIVLGERIGRGTHGEVFRGIWHGTEVAVKKLSPSSISPEFEQDLQHEAQLMRSLRHPNVLMFLAAGMVPPNLFIVMEFMARGSLFNVIHDDTVVWTWDLVSRIMIDAARGLAYLHALRVLHRDMKSHNVLVDENFKAKIADFGLSRNLSGGDHGTMTACGTPAWAAPELLRNQRYTEKADVYSFGVVLWECMSREVPYAGIPPFQVVYAVSTQGVRPPIPPDCPPEVASVISECFSEDPSHRPTLNVIIQRLDRIQAFGWSKSKPSSRSVAASPARAPILMGAGLGVLEAAAAVLRERADD